MLANSKVPDQTPRSAASDLGLHCLPMSQKWDARLIWLNVRIYFRLRIVFCSIEPEHDKTNKTTLWPIKDSQSARSLKLWVIGHPLRAQRRPWSDCAATQVDQSLCGADVSYCRLCRAPAHNYGNFIPRINVTSRLIICWECLIIDFLVCCEVLLVSDVSVFWGEVFQF